jgi:renalase
MIMVLLSSASLFGRRSVVLTTSAMQSGASRKPSAVTMMSTRATTTTSSTKVAILGSGIAGSTAARKLAENGIKVTVFESGYGPGGRTSTRTTRGPDSPTPPLQFDHGAQYISEPKSKHFKKAMDDWIKAGIVQDWKGSFAVMSADGTTTTITDASRRHYVGVPTMNSIAKHLLEHENINVVFQTRACGKFDESKKIWSLTRHGDESPLGNFSWICASDRLSATNNRADFRHAPVDKFKEKVKSIGSIPILVLMVAFEEKLDIPFDGVLFEGNEFGSLGYISRDSSKPGRLREDGQDCWVIQSNTEAATKVLSQIDGDTFEDKREKVREKSKQLLMEDFMAALPNLVQDKDSFRLPEVTYEVGHRWSASFPNATPSEKVCFLDDLDKNFVACGDYLGLYPGRVEGAFLSGSAAADTILNKIVHAKNS